MGIEPPHRLLIVTDVYFATTARIAFFISKVAVVGLEVVVVVQWEIEIKRRLLIVHLQVVGGLPYCIKRRRQ